VRRRHVALVAIALSVSAVSAWVYFATPLLDTPQRHIARYLAATARGDVNAALSEWSVYVSSTDPRYHAPEALVRERGELTRALASQHVGLPYGITSTDWWATCCTPRPIGDERNAGLARVHVTASNDNGQTYRLVFEIWVKDLLWNGDSAGEWLHDWRLYEVHEDGRECQFGGTAYGCA
jgi:hypothetical protein